MFCHSRATPKVMSLETLKEITNNFSTDRELGSGTFGIVYKGVQDGEEIAVKQLQTQGHDDHEEFMKEFDNLWRLRHPNVVQLLGYCYEIKREVVALGDGRFVWADNIYRALCFEYMHNGNLRKHLYDEYHGHDWRTRFKIIKGTCEGLKYLHEGLESPMYHLDLKPENILLDKNMVPKLADFGLSKLVHNNQTQVTQSCIGTRGYMPPEYIEDNLISNKLDIFSLGVVMIRIIAGFEAYYEKFRMSSQAFIDCVYANWRNRLQGMLGCTSLEAECHQVKGCIEIAINCVDADRQKRPTIGEVVCRLNELEHVIDMSAAPCQLQQISATMGPGESSSELWGSSSMPNVVSQFQKLHLNTEQKGLNVPQRLQSMSGKIPFSAATPEQDPISVVFNVPRKDPVSVMFNVPRKDNEMQVQGNGNGGGGATSTKENNNGGGGVHDSSGGSKNGNNGQPQNKKGVAPSIAADVGDGPGPLGGGMPPLAPSMVRPNIWLGGAGFPGMYQMGGGFMDYASHNGNMQPGSGNGGASQGMPAGGMAASGSYQGGAGAGRSVPSGPEMRQAAMATGNLLSQQQRRQYYMPVMQQPGMSSSSRMETLLTAMAGRDRMKEQYYTALMQQQQRGMSEMVKASIEVGRLRFQQEYMRYMTAYTQQQERDLSSVAAAAGHGVEEPDVPAEHGRHAVVELGFET